MSRKTGFIILCLMLAAVPAMAETLLLNGGQQTAIRLHIAQSIGLPKTAQKLALNFIQPVNFSSPTYNQAVEKFYVNYSTAPDREIRRRD